MARLTFDPRGENPLNQPLEVFDVPDGSLGVASMAFPAPPLDTVTAGGIDTEGAQIAARTHQNRQISLTLEVLEPASGELVNYVANPSFETGTTGWSTTTPSLNSGASLIAAAGDETYPASSGDSYGRIVTTGASSQQGASICCPALGTFHSGTAYRGQLKVRGTIAGQQVQVLLGATADDNGPFVTVTLTLDWQTVDVTWTPTADRSASTHGITVRTPAANSITVDIDDVMVAPATAPLHYFDGDTPGCAWTGTAHASTSTRPAAGGPRFRAIVAEVSAKMAKVAAEGGTLRWTNDDSESFTFDVLASDSYDVPMDIGYFAGPVALPALTLIARPYARRSKVDLASLVLPVGTSVYRQTFGAVTGDVPALGELILSDVSGSGVPQATVIWGLRCRDYDSASTASLFVQAEACTADDATSGTRTGSSGTVLTDTLTTGYRPEFHLDGTWTGTYRVIARAELSGTGTPALIARMNWRVQNDRLSTTAPATNGYTTGWQLLDLGVITLNRKPRGTHTVRLEVEACTDAGSPTVWWDYLMLVPVADGAGQGWQAGVGAEGLPLPPDGKCVIDHTGMVGIDAAGYVSEPDVYEGDTLMLPPATVGTVSELLMKVSRGRDGIGDSSVSDQIGFQLAYTPRVLNIR